MIVHKLPIGNGILTLPFRANILKAAMQHDLPYIWYEFDENETETIDINVRFIGTGESFDADDWTYVDTIFVGDYVWHVNVRER